MDLVADTIRWLADPANWAGPGAIPVRLAEHTGLSAASLLVAAAIAVPAGLWTGHTGRGRRTTAVVANVGRALPSLAVIGVVLPFTAALDPQAGFKLYPTVVAMVLLAIPPILINAETGIAGVDPALVEAARGMGLREGQVLVDVELPVATGAVAAGLRSAAVQVVATASLGAIFGGGGLGRFIVEGIAQNDDGKIFGGVVLIAAMALAVDGAAALAQRALTPGRGRPRASGEAPRGRAAIGW
jgi:osmoprotectant transport system permease protein